jgi:ATP-dependent protease Clp ATPase subunit
MSKETSLECSFCGRKKAETDLLIAGMDAHICDKCIEQAHGIVLEEIAEQTPSGVGSDLTFKKTFGNKRLFRSVYHWSRSNQKINGCSGL